MIKLFLFLGLFAGSDSSPRERRSELCQELYQEYNEMSYWCLNAKNISPSRREYICSFVKEYKLLCR